MYTIHRKFDNKEYEIRDQKLDTILRFEDRDKVVWNTAKSTYPDRAFWRLPIPGEDGILPGEYRLTDPSLEKVQHKLYINSCCTLRNDPEFLNKGTRIPTSYTRESREYNGRLRLKCYHLLSQQINEEVLSTNEYYEVSPWYLSCIYTFNKQLWIILNCFYCNSLRAFPYEKIYTHILDTEMNERLFCLHADYWELQNPGETYRLSVQESSFVYQLYRRDWMGDKYAVKMKDQRDGEIQIDYHGTFETACHDFYGLLEWDTQRIQANRLHAINL